MRRSQPSLSQAIRDIETTLQTPLFHRTGRGMELTGEGEAFAKAIAEPLAALDRAIYRASRNPEVKGRVTIAVPPSLSPWATKTLTATTVPHHPGLLIRIIEGHPVHMIEWLQKGEIDLALLYGPVQKLHFKLTPLFREPLVLIAKRSAGLDPAKPVEFQELGRLPLILPSRPFGIRAVVDLAAQQAGIRVALFLESDSGTSMRSMASEGLGYAIQPQSVTVASAEQMQLSWAPLVNPALEREVILAEPSDRAPGRAVEAATSMLAAAVCDLENDPAWDIAVSPVCRRLAASRKA
ncbi:DNA-binding transcriptional LysR family regulator [Rhodobium gokarnense]|uniref:DNA-binding transcriptional LysR family regulator n=2 Tax=Rhodobium gokarnense TaxID=364296 RepID=A0ABT3HBC1_9HYPH|nr:DNA-binding transcriptional LysR family regulator [Rhodobium gokarnense]